MRKLLRLTILGGLMVLFGGAAEDGMVFGIGSAQARIGRPLTPMSYAGAPHHSPRLQAWLLLWRLLPLLTGA